jgi:iron complex transport system ATP-binding protein
VQRGERLALDRLNLQVRDGEHVAILGPNGSGKSTLLKLLQRECYPLLHPDMQLRILGEENWNIFDLREKLGIVNNDLMAQCTRDITGHELVLSGFFGSVGIWPNHIVTAEHERIAREAMTQLGVAHLANRWTDELSSGEARRLLIARALIHRPKTLVLDEPTTSLDLAAQREMRETMRRLCREGAGLLLVTHHLEEVIPEITRVMLLRNGHIWLDGPKSEILNQNSLAEAFGAPVHLTTQGGFYRAW